MSEMQRYICPICETGGAHSIESTPPLCHICDFKVIMKAGVNDTILPTENKQPIIIKGFSVRNGWSGNCVPIEQYQDIDRKYNMVMSQLVELMASVTEYSKCQ